jgi:autotransporter-associated beta strand protein
VKRADAITFTGVSNSLTLQGGTLTGNIDVQAGSSATFNQSTNQTLGNVIVGAGQVIQNGIGTLTLTGTNTYSGGTQVFFGTLALSGAGTLGSTSGFVAVAVGTLDLGGTTQTQDGGVFLNNGTIRNGKLFSGWGFNVFGGGMVSAILAGTGMLSVNGSQTVALSGANTFSGGTVVNGGLINFSAANNFGTGSIKLNGGGLQWAIGNTTDISGSLGAIGSGGGTFDTNGNNVTLGSALMGTGGITKAGSGTLTLSGTNTYIGPTTVNAGILEVTGSLKSAVTINSGATLGGSGSVGNTTINGGTIAPGYPITFTVNGTFTQNGGTYTPNVTPAGGSDKIVVNGPATINGGMVAVQAANGRYARNTQYTILTATGRVTGSKYSSVTSNLAFLTPSLSYDNNNVFLSLLSSQNAFAAGGQTGNQKSVGAALDRANSAANADFLTVINTLSNLDTTQGPAALEAISGQPYANLGSSYVQTGAAFLDAFGSHLFGLHAGPPGTTMAQASTQVPAQAAAPATSDYCTFDCGAAVAPEAKRYGAWLSGVGGTGSVSGDSTGSARGFTYNFGGAAGGLDYRLSPELLVGFGGGWTGGTQRVSNFAGQAYLSTFSGLLYASWTPSAFYLDGAAGYANTTTNVTRVISIPGLAARFAQGQTSVNQFLGQVETGYKIVLPTWAPTSVAPFARLQGSTTNQPGFTESGAGSLDLVVAGQTTNSLRTTFGADFAARLPVGYAHTVDFDLRLGWVHEYADTGRPMNASFAGAPGSTFTVFGATSQRDSASIGFLARTHIASSTELYARYDGEVGGGTDNHAVNVGVRITW